MVVIIALVVGVFAYVFYSGAYAVDITSLSVTSPNDTCGYGAGLALHYAGHLSGYTGNSASISIGITNLNTTSSCTIRSATSNTSGFSIDGVQGVTIPPLSKGTLTFTLNFPSSRYTGPVWILFS